MKTTLRLVTTALALALGLVACAQRTLADDPALAPYAALQLRPAPVPAGALRATFFGTATLLLADDRHAVMVDGFFSRPGKLELAATRIAPDPERIDAALARGGVPARLDAVLVSHSHHDHALDAAVVACRTHATLVGTESTRNIARGQLGAQFQPERFRLVHAGQRLNFGSFDVEAIASPHSPKPLFDGEIAQPLAMPAHLRHFKMGGNHSFLIHHRQASVLVSASANVPEPPLNGVQASIVFLGIGGLGSKDEALLRRYWQAVVVGTGARVVVPIHWDDFTEPLAPDLPIMPRLFGDFDATMRVITELAGPQVAVRFLRPFEPVDLGALLGAAPVRDTAALAVAPAPAMPAPEARCPQNW